VISENWKIVPNFDDYEVSDLGRVRRCRDGGTVKAGKILKPCKKIGADYLIVGLVKEGKRHPFTVHRLVMDTFVGPLPEDDGYQPV
jgi:hypothetical protein